MTTHACTVLVHDASNTIRPQKGTLEMLAHSGPLALPISHHACKRDAPRARAFTSDHYYHSVGLDIPAPTRTT